jgi:hypothetical protein
MENYSYKTVEWENSTTGDNATGALDHKTHGKMNTVFHTDTTIYG